MYSCMALQIQALTFWLGSLMMSHVCTSYLSSHKPLWIKTTEVHTALLASPSRAKFWTYANVTTSRSPVYTNIFVFTVKSPNCRKWKSLQFYSSPLALTITLVLQEYLERIKYHYKEHWQLREQARRELNMLIILSYLSRTNSKIKVKHEPTNFY